MMAYVGKADGTEPVARFRSSHVITACILGPLRFAVITHRCEHHRIVQTFQGYVRWFPNSDDLDREADVAIEQVRTPAVDQLAREWANG